MLVPSVAPLLLAAALAAAGCGGGTPGPSARDLSGVQEELALRGVSIVNAVSGDAGCTDATLHGNAVRLEVRIGDGDAEQRVYLFRWRRPAQFDAAAAAFERCVAAFASNAPEQRVETLEVPPWRAYGGGWTDDLRQAVDDALHGAGGG